MKLAGNSLSYVEVLWDIVPNCELENAKERSLILLFIRAHKFPNIMGSVK